MPCSIQGNHTLGSCFSTIHCLIYKYLKTHLLSILPLAATRRFDVATLFCYTHCHLSINMTKTFNKLRESLTFSSSSYIFVAQSFAKSLFPFSTFYFLLFFCLLWIFPFWVLWSNHSMVCSVVNPPLIWRNFNIVFLIRAVSLIYVLCCCCYA